MGELINGRTPEHIKVGLRCRVTGDVKCSDCAYYGTVLYEIGQRKYECDDLDRDALALIERLESERDAALAKVPKWISVKERLPEEKESVLVHYVDGWMPIAFLLDGKWYQSNGETSWLSVTHWMPLPQPPEED